MRLLGTLLSVFLIISCTSKPEEEKGPKNIPVKVQQITLHSSGEVQEYIGTVEGNNMLDVSFPVMGKVQKMYVDEGQRVSEGQLLASLDRTTLKNAHELAVASLRQAEDAHKRMKAMYESNSIPEIQFVEVKTKLEQARLSAAIARKSLEDADIHAPQSGVIGTRYVEAGTNVMPGTPIYTIVDISSIKVKTPIPEGELSNIEIGSESTVTISALGDKTFSGKVVEKGILANPFSHTYEIKVQVSNPDSSIMPGMVSRVYLSHTGSGDQQIVIPLQSVQVDHTGKRFVWLKNDSKAEFREVTLGKLSGNGVIITQGLNPGEELITEGYQNISEGVAVSVHN